MILSSQIEQDDITNEISRVFDYSFDGITTFEIPDMGEIPEDFGIGLIVGPSGSGKSSILKTIGIEDKVIWDSNKSVCSHFDTAEDAKNKLSAVGLNSIPSWLKPFHVLSTGEKFRADLARKLHDNSIIDEFTSVVDRNVAKSCSYATRKYVDRYNIKNMIFATCHYDIIEWLQPDWVFDTSTNRLTVGRGNLCRPNIEIRLLPCSTKVWSLFRNHHYLSGDINKSSRCWVAIWDNVIVGFVSILAYPSGTVKNAWRGHRTVILPDYQGLGIGVRISDAIANIMVISGYRYFSKTSHPRMGEYREKSIDWKPTTKNKIERHDYLSYRTGKEIKYKHLHAHRLCYSHEYINKNQSNIKIDFIENEIIATLDDFF